MFLLFSQFSGVEQQQPNIQLSHNLAEVLGFKVFANGIDFGRVVDFVIEVNDNSVAHVIIKPYLSEPRLFLPKHLISEVTTKSRALRTDLSPKTLFSCPRFDPNKLGKWESMYITEHYKHHLEETSI